MLKLAPFALISSEARAGRSGTEAGLKQYISAQHIYFLGFGLPRGFIQPLRAAKWGCAHLFLLSFPLLLKSRVGARGGGSSACELGPYLPLDLDADVSNSQFKEVKIKGRGCN